MLRLWSAWFVFMIVSYLTVELIGCIYRCSPHFGQCEEAQIADVAPDKGSSTVQSPSNVLAVYEEST